MTQKGIIFYKFRNNTLELYLSKNNDDKYEDIKIKEDINIIPFYKFYDNTNMIYFLDINKHKNIYDKIIQKKENKIISVNLSTFNKPSIHKYAKINKLKNTEIQIILDKIKLNYVIRKTLKHHL
jgi:hypothetical protein